MSENAIAIREEITEAKILEYLDSAGITKDLLENEKKMFFNIAREFGLNPFKREIHITAYGKGEYRKCSIITGYEVYLKRAERTGKLDGWSVKYEGEGKSMKAIVEIYRKDQKYPFVHEVYYAECCQYNKEGHPNAIWAKMPRFMTKKVAIGQAFRLCFPNDLGGMPYEESELPQEEPRNVTKGKNPPNETQQEEEPQSKPGEAEERHEILKSTGEILKTLNHDGSPYFSSAEIDMAREIARGADIETLKNQNEHLKNELEEREAVYHDGPSWWEEDARESHKKDDIPIF